MKLHQLQFGNGEPGVLREIGHHLYACPVCGEIWPEEPPIFPAVEEGHDSQWNLGEICRGCGCEMGLDVGDGPDMAVGAVEYLFRLERGAWLDRIGWTDQALQQLEANLEINRGEAKADVEEARQMFGLKALVRAGDLHAVRDMVLHCGVPINTKYGTSIPLYIAIQKGHIEIVKFLVEHGAALNVPPFCRQTPLSLAKKHHQLEIAGYIRAQLEAGAK